MLMLDAALFSSVSDLVLFSIGSVLVSNFFSVEYKAYRLNPAKPHIPNPPNIMRYSITLNMKNVFYFAQYTRVPDNLVQS